MTDEPLGSHVLELQVADVVAETDDARSLVFKVPDGADIPASETPVRPRPVPDAAHSQRPHRLRRTLLLAVHVAVHRRRDGRHGQAHRRRLRVELAVRPRPPGHEAACARAVGNVRAAHAGCRLPARRRRQRHHPDDGDLQVGAGRRRRQDRARLRQPRRELGDLRWRAARPGRQVSRPADRRALAGIGAGHPHRDRARQPDDAVCVARCLHLRTRSVHGSGPGRAGHYRRAQAARARRGVPLVGHRPVRGGGDRGRQRRAAGNGDRAPRRPDGTRSAGRATPSCSTCCWTRVSTRRSRAARATAVRAPCSSAAARSTWRSTTCSSSPTSTRG